MADRKPKPRSTREVLVRVRVTGPWAAAGRAGWDPRVELLGAIDDVGSLWWGDEEFEVDALLIEGDRKAPDPPAAAT